MPLGPGGGVAPAPSEGAAPAPLAADPHRDTFGGMPARWVTFGIGLWLVLAPLVLGYGSAGAILQDVAVGLLVAVGALAALEWPRARFLMTLPALWLVHVGRSAAEARAAAAELGAGALLLALSLVPSSRRVPRAGAVEARQVL